MNIEQLRAQIAALQDATMDENGNFRSGYDEGKFDALSAVDALLDSLQEEPVGDNLEKAAVEAFKQIVDSDKNNFLEIFKAGAKWKKEHLWKPADGDDLPEYDREVIAIIDYDFGHYKVVYAHRPNPNGWNGTNIDTGKEEHFKPVIYDKAGWNQPHVLYWLDAKLPYEEDKIIR